MPGLPAADMNAVWLWLGLLWGAGMLCRPLARLLLPGQSDDGYLTGKALGWALGGFAPWLAASLGLIDFARQGPVVALAVLGAAFLLARGRVSAPALGPARLAGLEALFLGLFALGLLQRLAEPDLLGLEKFTNLAFLTAAMGSASMPPPDPWFAGQPVNYYYLGHAVAALWANLAAVPPHHGYQLAHATLFALTGSLAFHLLRELLWRRGRTVATVTGLLAACLVLLAGNGHSFLYQVLRPWMPTPKPEYWYPDSTRFIGFEPPTDDKAFTEFPAYGFLVGDLHAHLLATPLAVLLIVVLLALLRSGWATDPRDRAPPLATAGLLGWLLGLSFMTNAWDLAVSGLLALLAWLVLLVRQRGPWSARLDGMAAAALAALAVAAATAAPFVAAFRPFAGGILPVEHRTPLWQLLVIYWPVVPALLLLAALGVRLRRSLSAELAMALLLALGALVLVALPEIVFVKDIYGADHARANTMFKLSFRSQPMLQVTGLFVVGWLATSRRRAAPLLAAAILVPLSLPLAYAKWTLRGGIEDLDLDGLRFLGEERDLVTAISRLPIEPGESLVEAGSDSFTPGARVATVAGLPSVVGWMGHEWLWRGDLEAAMGRRDAVDRFYTEADAQARCRFVAAYRLRYVVIARAERERYPGLGEPALAALGREVVRTDAGRVIEVLPEACPPRGPPP